VNDNIDDESAQVGRRAPAGVGQERVGSDGLQVRFTRDLMGSYSSHHCSSAEAVLGR
jgi:hypothetical protein